MRQRLLLVLLLFSLSAVTAFAVPLLMSTASERTQQFVISRTADLDRFATLPADVVVSEALRYHEIYGEEVVVVNAAGEPVVEAGMKIAEVSAQIDAALRNQPAAPVPTVMPWSGGDVLFARPVGTGTKVAGAVVLRASTSVAALDVARRWAFVLAGALLAACACVLLALVVARWLLRPLKELDRGVRAVAEGQRRTHVADTAGPAELRALSESFNRMSDAVAEAADQQRRLIADASHQLRNPMAALRLRVDMLPSNGSLLTEVERLESLLDGLLALASAESTATERAAGGVEPELADLQVVAHDRVDAWRAAAHSAGATITVEDRAAGLVRCAVSDLAQVLDVLLDNAIKYGGPEITVICDRATLIVRDNGDGLSEEDIARATERFWRGDDSQRGTGLGLAIAERIVTAHDGTLTLRSDDTVGGLVVTVELPKEPLL
ncbi:signal transduction histidine kinase [Lentzea atacamensis]|uniref:histidine kinase n=2 Tax=Lentzea TaxID=165301 RepID=A0A316HSI0_9PSEU|nr:HAMP domain-containing sensor histidine kinase [Lentzea atacamensis]PWK82970.1 signal transduction histidine kinase [Lentzea atacamensis]RAS62391.1 signal transduction histidine kinase [Lentzea atacamensis]